MFILKDEAIFFTCLPIEPLPIIPIFLSCKSIIFLFSKAKTFLFCQILVLISFSNLFEFPILFYVVCICIYITGNVDDHFVSLAYWFFYVRVLHSVYHICFNQLIVNGGFPLRALLWLPATAILVYMWIRFISVL